MSTHTPGPWETYRDGDRIHVVRAGTLVLLNTSGSHVRADWIAEIDPDGTGHTPGETEADARLIAAAPDLYEACKAAMAQVDDCLSQGMKPFPETVRLIEVVRAAIAKAEGQ